jgi:LysM repeat protein
MNNPSPLVPQGSIQDLKNQGRARVKIAVFVVLAVHGIGLLALLMQGCKKEPEASTLPPDQAASNAAPAFVETTNTAPADTNLPPLTATPPAPVESAAPPAAITDYKIVQGDTFSTIARKFHTTTRGLMDANPGIEPTKLKIGQSIKIPAPVAPPPPGSGTASPAAGTQGGEQIYVVKSGDTLIRIAADHKTSVKALRSANSLTTDKIKVGQKLKIPASASAPATAAPPAVTPVESAPAPAPGTTSAAPVASPR